MVLFYHCLWFQLITTAEQKEYSQHFVNKAILDGLGFVFDLLEPIKYCNMKKLSSNVYFKRLFDRYLVKK